MKNYYQPEIETMPVKELQALQSERLVKQVQFVYDKAAILLLICMTFFAMAMAVADVCIRYSGRYGI